MGVHRGEAQLISARLQAEADGELSELGLVASIQFKQSQAAVDEHVTRYALEQERLQLARDTVEAQLAVEQAEVNRLRTLYELRQGQVDDLRVRAGIHGVLQQVPLDEGQRVTARTVSCDAFTRLLAAEYVHRIDTRRPPSREPARDQRHGHEHERLSLIHI